MENLHKYYQDFSKHKHYVKANHLGLDILIYLERVNQIELNKLFHLLKTSSPLIQLVLDEGGKIVPSLIEFHNLAQIEIEEKLKLLK
tara:strand:+ start:1185 stop:1445 length:261 start_codon:yes stop_codon:yes gene_type:complete